MKGECKFSIYDDKRFIYPLPERESVNFQFTMIMDLLTLYL